MTRRLFVSVALLLLTGPAWADCSDDVCVSLQKILAARSGNFAKLKGKPTVDTRGDAVWQGTQPIGSLINTCYVYKRGEGARYEYRCWGRRRLLHPSLLIGSRDPAESLVRVTGFSRLYPEV